MKALAQIVLLAVSTTSCAGTMEKVSTRIDACGSTKSWMVDGDTVLDIAVSVPRADYLLVRTHGQSFVVRDHEFQSRALAFSSSRVFRVQLNRVTGKRWADDGKLVEARVYAGPGAYELYFSDNLETEPENSSTCRVQLVVGKESRSGSSGHP